MRLADFIERRLSTILYEWEGFAKTLLPAAATMSSLALLDHAEEMLRAIADDLRTSQSDHARQRKSWGLGDADHGSMPATAAQVHGALRASAGISIQQLVSEFRALRASVLRLYAAEVETAAYTLVDIGRFNEAIDQAIAESIQVFQSQLEHWRNLFLGVLQHDLRGPLQAVLSSSYLVAALPDGQPRELALARLRRSGERMKSLLDELLDYNRTTLNLGLPMNRVPSELAGPCQEEVELRRLAHPEHLIQWRAHGPTHGLWDASRIQQALGNLIANAAKHGAPHGAIGVELRGSADDVRIIVDNQGPPLGEADIAVVFDPLRRSSSGPSADPAHLGLGLFVVRQIAQAHGGDVGVESADGRTRFCLRLPRALPA